MSTPVLDVRGLGTSFDLGGWPRRRLRAVHDVSFTLDRGQSLALVGESGSGKSTIARMLLRLVPATEGEIRLDGVDVLAAEPRRASLAYRRRVQMIFQDPFASLNPAHRVRHHLSRPLLIHGHATPENVESRALTLLEQVGLTPATAYLDAHTFSLSGGQRQRVAIARALAVQPDVLVADEPTSMLDVSIRMEILELLQRLRQEHGLGLLFITHDLRAANWLCDRIMVLYAGQTMEVASSESIVRSPMHPYSQLLMAAVPRPGHGLDVPLPAKPGSPKTIDPGPGCAFASRCLSATDRCRATSPSIHALAEGHLARCHLVASED